ncbi:MAG: peptide-methionine (S)-S-oxide reductase MsrA [Alphaproteobacteria bacterium]|jgi:peptide-methionine (S)-S-oxide reductase|nr:peptide-methionine (S)-S-oxide reductase MsrA [Alphaproteobacteria bacterium]
MLFSNPFKARMPLLSEALPGREMPVWEGAPHGVLGTPTMGPFADNLEEIHLGLGCFWGAERLFWKLDGVFTTAVGYAGGFTPNPTYEEVCSGRTGHTEVVMVVYDPSQISLGRILKTFFEEHDPTQGYRQGNDFGTQYRSAIFTTSDAQLDLARRVAADYGAALAGRGLGEITTEIGPAGPFYYAEDYHQQYLHKVPNGYCGLKGTGVVCAG